MIQDRFVITDGLWTRLEPCLPGEVSDSGGYELPRHGATFRAGFGNWNTQFHRFRRWAKGGVFESLFKAVNNDPDLEYPLIHGTIVQAHQKAAGAKGGLKITPSGARAAA